MPKISVLVQSHNRPEGLQRALQSLQMQSYRDFEVVISDDSVQQREQIMAVLEGPAAAGLQLNVNYTDACGAAESMREALGRASGEYIKILHDDDWLTPHSLQQQTMFLDHHADVNVVYGRAILSFPHIDKLAYAWFDKPTKLPAPEWIAQYQKDGAGPVQSPVTALYRRHDGFRVLWSEFINPDLREAARKTGAGTDVSLQVDNAGSNASVVLIPMVACFMGTDMNSITQVDPGIHSYYAMWKAEYDSFPAWRR